MSNAKHHGRISEVWKHLVIGELAGLMRPDSYLETHSGSASYPVADDPERRFGVLYFRSAAGADRVLASTGYYASLVAHLGGDRASLCPGSAVVAMDALGASAQYVLCDTDPESAQSLRTEAKNKGLEHRVEVVESDGMTEVARRVLGGTLNAARGSLVFVDPFEPGAVGPGGLSALTLTGELIDAGMPTAYWYGYSTSAERCWAWEELAKRDGKPIWCGDIMVRCDGDRREEAAGNLGEASTPGTGSGVVVANVNAAVLSRLKSVAVSLEALYRHTPLPDGRVGSVDVSLRIS